MSSFDDVHRIFDAATDANIVPYQHMPRLDDEVYMGDPVARLGLGTIYDQEMVRARRRAFGGGLAMHAGVTGVMSGVYLEIMQTEQQQKVAAGEKPYDFLIAQVASLPIDWKAVATAGVAFAATSGARRASRPHTVGRDIEKVNKQAALADEFIPHTRSSFKHFRRMRAVREAGITVAATGSAYEVGTVLSPLQNVILGIGLAAVATARTLKAEFQFKRRGY